MRQFGLIGYPLGHSFSKGYFTEKFRKENISDAAYELYPLQQIELFPQLLEEQTKLVGLNVTIPYKEQVIPYLNRLDRSAEKVGAVNVIKKEGRELVGYNSDYFGFKQSLEQWMGQALAGQQALVLGTGGAAKAVCAALSDLQLTFQLVSRRAAAGVLSYTQLVHEPQILHNHRLIINTTPVGMQPYTDTCPELPYEHLEANHYLYDLVYNPAETLFMKKGAARGTKVKNGLEMLHLQAEKAWEIWNS